MKSNNQYQQQYLKKRPQQKSSLQDFLTITSDDGILCQLFKIGIKADMIQRGINKFEDYVVTLVKEYPLKPSSNPLP
jgi:hypothetical protein